MPSGIVYWIKNVESTDDFCFTTQQLTSIYSSIPNLIVGKHAHHFTSTYTSWYLQKIIVGLSQGFHSQLMKIPFRLQEQKVFIWHILYSMHSSSYFSAQIQNHAIQLKFSSMKVSHYSSILLLSLPKPCNSRCIILYYRHDNYYRRFHVLKTSWCKKQTIKNGKLCK